MIIGTGVTDHIPEHSTMELRHKLMLPCTLSYHSKLCDEYKLVNPETKTSVLSHIKVIPELSAIPESSVISAEL